MTYPNAREMRYVEITNVSVRVATSETASRSVRVLNIILQIKLYTMKILLFVIVIIVVLNINLSLSYIKNVAINHLSKISTLVLFNVLFFQLSESCGGKVCGKNARCTNYGRRKKCKCISGFYGDGITCTGNKIIMIQYS